MATARPSDKPTQSLNDSSTVVHDITSTKRKSQLEPSPFPHPSMDTMPPSTDYMLNPPPAMSCKFSPTKSHRRASSAQPVNAQLTFLPISAPSPPTFKTDSPSKRHSMGSIHGHVPSFTPQMTYSIVPNGVAAPLTESHFQIQQDAFADFPDPTCDLKLPVKRTLMEAAPMKDRSTRKQKRDETSALTLPEPYEMPPIEDDGSKPPYSYATLIGMSILRAPNRRLTLAQIYKWISDTFSFYRSGDTGWQNSIRHNLSLNKAFIKQERPKDDPGKGNYWAIEPGMESQFLKDKLVRRATLSSIPFPAVNPQCDSLLPPTCGTTTWRIPPPPLPTFHPPVTSKTQDLSSDATLPASDPALHDESGDEGGHHNTIPTVSVSIPRSSPPQIIHSSPPLAPQRLRRHGTPPTPTRPLAPSMVAANSRKRSAATMNDSGYYSSLDSSVMRSNKAAHILTSDLDIEPPRIKRGRAEEEIARIRSSSHDISPSHSKMSKATLGSSPFRGDLVSLLPPPLTPAIKFKKPNKPPPSLSPNTNLRNHRKRIQQMVNSPIKHLGLGDEELPWSPAFDIHDENLSSTEQYHIHFDIFTDPVLENVATPLYQSPNKRGASSVRPNNAASILSDVTASKNNRQAALSHLANEKPKGLANLAESPSKRADTTPFLESGNDDFFSFNLFDDGSGDVDGIDLLQGFQKIGEANKDDVSFRGHGSRPHLSHRNHTSFF